MKKTLAIVALTCMQIGTVSADQYYQSYGYDQDYYCPSCNYDNYYNQSQGGYYRESGDTYQSPQYYQQSQQSSGYQGYSQPSSQSYYQQPEGYYNQSGASYNQSGSYYNQSGNQQSYRPSGSSYPQSHQQWNSGGYYVSQTDTQAASSDQDISKKVKDTLSNGQAAGRFQNITFEVSNGNVSLKGTIDTLDNKLKLEDSIRKINGVKQVTNDVKVNKESADAYYDTQSQQSTDKTKFSQDTATTDQDKMLNTKIRDRLNTGAARGNTTIVIKTANGIVFISGTVEKPEDVQKITDQVKSVDGVKTVNNQLTVKRK